MPLRSLFRKFASVFDLNLRSTGKWLFLSTLVGIVAGLGATLFHFLCQTVSYEVLGGLSGFPFAGNTGFGAMAAHIPDNGFCLLIHGPHVGICQNGYNPCGLVTPVEETTWGSIKKQFD